MRRAATRRQPGRLPCVSRLPAPLGHRWSAGARHRRSAGPCGLRAASGATGPGGDGLWSSTSFEALGVHPALVQALAAQDIARPTVVQADSFGPIVRGRDALLRAETGSGKTLAYLLPLVNRIYYQHDRARAAAEAGGAEANPLQSMRPWVVLAPTSDLCAQILAMLEAVDVDRLVAPQSLQRLFRWEALRGPVAGAFREPRLKEVTRVGPSSQSSAAYATASPRIRWGAVDVVVSTPSKFCEELQQMKEDRIFPACVVMDEADALFQGVNRLHLFDIFGLLRPRVRAKRADEPRRRLPDMIPTQFIFASATMVHIGPFSPGNMLIERFCTAHTVETPYFHRLPAGIDQDSVRWLTGSDDWERRIDQLLEILRDVPCERTLVFVNSLHNCHVLLGFLRSAGWPVASFMKGRQGRMGPRFRDAREFADGRASIMLATEFGGRGIDWHEVDHVVNFQMPTSAVGWLHRVGRTGRMGKRGLVTNLVGIKDQALAQLIQERLLAGKDLHGAFSRRRSLRRKTRALAQEGGGGGDDEAPTPHRWEGGSMRMEGGLEIFERGLTGGGATPGSAEDAQAHQGADSGGTLLGYLSSPEAEDDQPVGRRQRQVAAVSGRQREAGDRRGGASALGEGGPEGADGALADLRARLLDSDSESEGSGAEDSDGGATRGAPAGASEQAPFQWSRLGDAEEGGASLGPEPQRQLLNRGARRDGEPPAARGGGAASRAPAAGSGRKRRGVKAASRAAAGRNYAEPEDDLLL